MTFTERPVKLVFMEVKMSRRAILRKKNERAKEVIYPKGLNFHYDEIKDKMTIEGVVFEGEDFRQHKVGVVKSNENECQKCGRTLKSKAGRIKHESTCDGNATVSKK